MKYTYVILVVNKENSVPVVFPLFPLALFSVALGMC